MNKYLVISYNDDQQEWFYDIVFADSEDAAVKRICEDIRPYVIAADATSASQLERMHRCYNETTREKSEGWLQEVKS